MLIEAQMPCDDHARHVDVLCFTKSDTHEAVGHADHHADESDTHSAVRPVALEPDAENEEDDASNYSSEEEHNLNESADSEHLDADHVETDSAARPVESPGIDMDTDGAVRPADCRLHVHQLAQHTVLVQGRQELRCAYDRGKAEGRGRSRVGLSKTCGREL